VTRPQTAEQIHLRKTLERLRQGGWPEVLTWTDRTILATRAGVVLPDEDDMTLVVAAGHLATAPHLRIPADWENYSDGESYKRG
jgi:hypothetical protein